MLLLTRRLSMCDVTFNHSRLMFPHVCASLTGPNGFTGAHDDLGRSLISRPFSVSSSLAMPYEKKTGPRGWPRYNKVVFPPQQLEEKRRPAYVCHMITNIKYPPWKMWYVTCFVRGMSVDKALEQLSYVRKKGAFYVRKAILEAQELAVQRHNVEFRSNLWVAESFASKGVVIKGIRRHARQRIGTVEYFHCHYFVRLEEGPPPEHYLEPHPDGPTLLQRWIQERREQRVYGSI